jgi:hypothetical protein
MFVSIKYRITKYSKIYDEDLHGNLMHKDRLNLSNER